MGGYGSGRRLYCGAKPSTDDGYRLDVRWLARHGYLAPADQVRTSVVAWHVRGRTVADVITQHDGDADTLAIVHGADLRRQVFRIERTPCTYGGDRPWLVCHGCGHRRAVLYLYAGWIACRRCQRMNYATTRMSVVDRLGHRADRLRRRLDPNAERAGWPVPDRPRGMHWTTYLRIALELDRTTAEAMLAITGDGWWRKELAALSAEAAPPA